MDEQQILHRLRQPASREAAFRDLMKLYQQGLYWHIRKMVFDHDDADDILQNAFIKVWKAIDGFRGESSLKTWVWRIATNETLTFLEKKKRMMPVPVEDVEDDMRMSTSGSLPMDGDAIHKKLEEAVQTLPDKQRMVFHMKYYDEMKYEEMAEILGGTVGSLKASFHHAVKKIEKYFGGD